MRLENGTRIKHANGFTIIELLIVIIIIAILATVAIAAQLGIQGRARDTANKNDAIKIADVAESINLDKGSYPGGATTPLLQASFASSDMAKLPVGVSVLWTGESPSFSLAKGSADSARSFYVQTCAAGVNVYYPVRDTSAVQAIRVGAGC